MPVVTVVMTLLVLIFSEVLPKTYAIRHADGMALAVAPAMRVIVFILAPITAAISWIVSVILKIFSSNFRNVGMTDYVDELRGAIELHVGPEEEIRQERAMLRSILDLADVEVSEIMTHRRNVEAIDADLPPTEAVDAVLQSPYTRLPIWQNDPDNVVGVLHAKDVLRAVKAHRDDPRRPEHPRDRGEALVHSRHHKLAGPAAGVPRPARAFRPGGG